MPLRKLPYAYLFALGLYVANWASAPSSMAQSRTAAPKGIIDPHRAEYTYDHLTFRAGLGLGLLISPDQTSWLHYDGPGGLLEATVGYHLLPWLGPRVSLVTGGFSAAQGPIGGLVAPAGGLEVTTEQASHKLYVFAEAGPGFTGGLTRLFTRLGAGIDFSIATTLMLGPQLTLGQVWQPDGPTQSSDARYLAVSVLLSFRAAELISPATQPTRPAEPWPQSPPLAPEFADTEPTDIKLLLDRAAPVRQVELLAPVLFRTDSAELTPTTIAMLHEVRQQLAQRPDLAVLEVRGYADKRGPSAYNIELSRQRAKRVRTWLVEHGVAPERLVVAPHGEEEPVESGSSERELQQNRRVIFRVIKKASVP